MKKFIDSFSTMAQWLAKFSGILLLLMSILVCCHVILRGIFGSGILGTYELVQYGMLVIVSLTLAENELSGGNIIVNFLLDKMRPRVANLFSIVMYFITIVFMCFVLHNQVGMIGTKLADGSVTGTLGIPHWILVSLICIGLFFFIIAFIIRVYNMITQHKTLDDRKRTLEEIAAEQEIKSEF
ncbi:MAG: TRAP transporter small permease [Peptococcaceae bacterium]|nr:TRAP transporter small permease [Peptococcaceae bacterium]